jgi:hypothetical protein
MRFKTFTILSFLILLFPLASVLVSGQNVENQDPDIMQGSPIPNKPHGNGDQGDEFMRKAKLKAEIENAERDNDKMKSASLQLLELSYQLHDAVVAKNLITDENLKRLNGIEKLAKEIREKSGGTGDKNDNDVIPPQFEDCVKQLNDLAEKLNKEVEKTSRYTTSATVIDGSNRIYYLVDQMRKRFFHK